MGKHSGQFIVQSSSRTAKEAESKKVYGRKSVSPTAKEAEIKKVNGRKNVKFPVELNGCWMEKVQELEKYMDEHEKDLRNTPELLEIFQLRIAIVKERLLKARDGQRIIDNALQHFREVDNRFPEKKKCRKVLKMFAAFMAAGNPFSDEFLGSSEAVCGRHKQMLEKIEALQGKLDDKVKRVKVWLKISDGIFVGTFLALLICTIVTGAVAAPQVAALVAAAAQIPFLSLAKWVKELSGKYVDPIKRQLKIISAMDDENSQVVSELVNIYNLVNDLVSKLSSMVKSESVEFCLSDCKAVLKSIEDIKHIKEQFDNDIYQCLQIVNKCERQLERFITLSGEKICRRSLEKQNPLKQARQDKKVYDEVYLANIEKKKNEEKEERQKPFKQARQDKNKEVYDKIDTTNIKKEKQKIISFSGKRKCVYMYVCKNFWVLIEF